MTMNNLYSVTFRTQDRGETRGEVRGEYKTLDTPIKKQMLEIFSWYLLFIKSFYGKG